ncbi:MAG: peptidoglycan glycosyltransferase [Bacillota bacterium]|nr:MAG: peptidoglycan glycosyltransferase [Bacillota bacterium]
MGRMARSGPAVRMPGIGLRRRIFVLFLAFMLALLILAGRLVTIQVVRGEELRQKAVEMRLWQVPVQARRGDIVDRNGRALAVSADVDTVYVAPAELQEAARRGKVDIEEAARQLARALHMDPEQVYEKLTVPHAFWYVKRRVTDEESRAVRALDIPGIHITQEARRFYPKGDLAAHVLGFAGVDNQGLEGIEAYYDDKLKGQDGYIATEYDARGRPIRLPTVEARYVRPKPGLTLRLTLDETIQYVAERELDKAVATHGAKGGVIIVMDPKTGGILALASRPTYDPNRFADFPRRNWRIKAVADAFPPGSIFKIITGSAAVDAGKVTPDTVVDDPGFLTVLGQTVSNWNQAGLGSVPFREGFAHSSNVVFGKMALALGKPLFYEYLNRFNIGRPTGVDLPGEATGIVPPMERATQLDLAIMGFGQTLTTTPIQMAAAVAAVANDGVWQTPHLADAWLDEEGRVVEQVRPAEQRRVISAETARTIRQLMQGVVEQGTGRRAQVPGYEVGGKTGTANKVEGGRVVQKYIGSFVGLVPVDDPRLVIVVSIDEPSGIYYGGYVAAPVFQAVARDVLRYLGVPPSREDRVDPRKLRTVPSLLNLTRSQARQRAEAAGFQVTFEGNGATVVGQFPTAGARLEAGSTLILYTEAAGRQDRDGRVTVPALRGLTYAQVAERLAAVGLQLRAVGDEKGVAAAQDPPAGTRVPLGSVVTVTFQQRTR